MTWADAHKSPDASTEALLTNGAAAQQATTATKAAAQSDTGGPLPSAIADRVNAKMDNPSNAVARFAHVGFVSPGGDIFNTDKDENGQRYDAVPIANGFVLAGAACDLLRYEPERHDQMVDALRGYDGVIVRINPGQLCNPGVPLDAQAKFDGMVRDLAASGKVVWSSPDVRAKMGAKDALVDIRRLKCGLRDTYAYYDAQEFRDGFRKSAAFSPRVIKQNRGAAGQGIWLCWLEDKEYCAKLGDAVLEDGDKLKLIEMNDNHVEHHTVGEFLAFCEHGPGGAAGEWKSVIPGKYFEGGKEEGGWVVDQRLLPRVAEGEVRLLMVKDTVHKIIHKKPLEGGYSAVGGVHVPTVFAPDAPEYADLRESFDRDLPKVMEAMNLTGQPLPLLWTADFIPSDGPEPGSTVYVVGEFNCECVGVSYFGAACGADRNLSWVSDANYVEGMALTRLMGEKALEALSETRGVKGVTAVPPATAAVAANIEEEPTAAAVAAKAEEEAGAVVAAAKVEEASPEETVPLPTVEDNSISIQGTKEENAAAIKLQAVQRGRIARAEVEKLKAEGAAAEAVEEKEIEAAMFEGTPEEQQAAVRLQAMQRGRMARAEVARLKEAGAKEEDVAVAEAEVEEAAAFEGTPEEQAAATKLQAMQRGRMARSRVAKMKESGDQEIMATDPAPEPEPESQPPQLTVEEPAVEEPAAAADDPASDTKESIWLSLSPPISP